MKGAGLYEDRGWVAIGPPDTRRGQRARGLWEGGGSARGGGALRHLHIVYLYGVFDHEAEGALYYFQATPTSEDFEGLVVEVGLVCKVWLAEPGFAGNIEDGTEDEE